MHANVPEQSFRTHGSQGASEPPKVIDDVASGVEGRGAPGGESPAGEKTVDLLDVWRALLARKRFILLCSMLFFAVTIGLTLHSSMTFIASGSFYLGDAEAPSIGGLSRVNLSPEGLGGIASEIQIIRSRRIIGQAAINSGLNVDVRYQGFRDPNYLDWRMSERDLELLRQAPEGLLVTATPQDPTDAQVHELRLKLKGDGDFEIASKGERRTGKNGDSVIIEGQEIRVVTSGPVSSPSRASLKVTIQPMDRVVANAMDALDVLEPPEHEGTKVLSVTYSHHSPFQAAAFVKQLMREYLRERHDWRSENARAAEDFVASQVMNLRESLAETEQKIVDFSQQNSILAGSETDAETLLNLMGQHEQQRSSLRLEIASLERIRGALKSPEASLASYMFGETSDAVLQGMATGLKEAREELIDLAGKFTDDSAEVRRQREKLLQQQDMIRNYVDGRLLRANGSLHEVEGIMAEYSQKLEQVPALKVGLERMQRESEVYGKVFSNLLAQQQETAVQKASTVSRNRVLDAPALPLMEAAPKLGARLSSGIAGIVFGAAMVILQLYLSQCVRSENEARSLAAGIPVFASLPALSTKIRAEPSKAVEGRTVRVSFPGLSDERVAKNMRGLLTNLYMRQGSGRNVVLVTSPDSRDGKSTCASYLAAVFAANGRSTLLVQSEMASGSTSTKDTPQVKVPIGLHDVLTGKSSWEKAVQQVAFEHGAFDRMGPGVVNPLQMASPDAHERLFAQLREAYEVVVVDSAAYPREAEVLSLTRMADTVLSVIRVGKTSRELTRTHLCEVAKIATSHGVVVNLVPPAGKGDVGNVMVEGAPQGGAKPGSGSSVDKRDTGGAGQQHKARA